MSTATPAPKKRQQKTSPLLGGYFQLSQQPLQSLIFLAPLIVLYELGTLLYVTDPVSGFRRHILAHSMLRRFFEAIGVGEKAFYLPGLIVVVVLLSLHLARKDRLQFHSWLYPLMGLESILLSLPLFVLMLVGYGALRQMGLQSVEPATAMPWPTQMVYSVGAGIYEELLFRLIAIALIHMFLVDALALPRQTGAFGAIAVSATLFALYHFGPRNPFDFGRFVFYCAAGVYFAAIYLLRGFGIVAATHAMYDILVVVLQMAQHPQHAT